MPDQPYDLTIDAPQTDYEIESDGSPPPALPTNPGLLVDFVSDGGDPHLSFGLAVSTLWVSGLASAPVAGGPRSGKAVWRCCSDTSLKVVTFALQRLGAVPVVPHIESNSGNDILISREISLPATDDLPDGTRCYTVYGRYVYDMHFPMDLAQPLIIPNTALRAPQLLQLDPNQFSRLLAPQAFTPAEYDGRQVNF